MVVTRSAKSKKKPPKPYVGYAPKPPVYNLMKEALQWAKELEKNSDAGDSIEKVLKNQSKESRRLKRRLDRRKMDVLNKHIFPSMANLTVFLEYMVKSPYVDYMFEDDLKALFFSKASPNVNKNDKSIFERFIEAVSKVSRRRTNKDGTESVIPASDYRLILCDKMQESIMFAMLWIGTRKFRHEQFLDHTLAPDMNRAFAWTSQTAYEACEHLVFDEKRRPPQF